jgi:hypothetical protein
MKCVTPHSCKHRHNQALGSLTMQMIMPQTVPLKRLMLKFQFQKGNFYKFILILLSYTQMYHQMELQKPPIMLVITFSYYHIDWRMKDSKTEHQWK